MMLVIQTQVFENYAWDENGNLGTGDKAYWKAKGGCSYKIKNVPLNIDYAAVVKAAPVGQDDDYFREYVIDWSIESDDWLSGFERDQLEYDGEIAYPEPWAEYAAVVDNVAV